MKEIKIDFEKFEGGLKTLIDSSAEGDMYLLQMINKHRNNDKIEVKFCEVHRISNGMIGIINGHFSTDFGFMELIGVCKLIV